MKNNFSENVIGPISDYIKTTDLFIAHNGDALLNSLTSANEMNTGSGMNGS